MENSLQQTVFPNAPKSKWIISTSSMYIVWAAGYKDRCPLFML